VNRIVKQRQKADRHAVFDFSALRQRLLRWYRWHQRDLPWRKTHDPYKIWVSEIMLQQTQVSSVIPYYQRFLAVLPTTASLAKAPLQKVLKLWEGAGYYARARNLHRAARMVMKEYNGEIPSDPDLLQMLPGIGRSTAGAIASLAFGRRAPILDGNARRVLCRLFGILENPRGPAVERELWRLSEACLPDRRIDQFNQALMDLGATVCMPAKPSCLLCPVRGICRAYRLGIQEKVPVRIQRPPLPHHQAAAAVILRSEKLLIGRRPSDGLLGGLWGLPEIQAKNGASTDKEAHRGFENLTGLKLQAIKAFEPVTHTFTHLRMTFYPVLYQCQGGQLREDRPWRWANRSTLSGFPISVATRKILSQVLSLDQIDHRNIQENIPVAAEGAAPYS
jgi:A/G-specific adenine glycosylase